MSNPSTIWSTLALPNPASGSIPFVDTDNATLITDVVDFAFEKAGITHTSSKVDNQITVANGTRKAYSDTTSVPGNATINKTAGRVRIATGASGVIVTCSAAFITSIINLQLENNDANLVRVWVTPGNGTFTITGNANAAAPVNVTFNITNVY